jgi:hypothetical protein
MFYYVSLEKERFDMVCGVLNASPKILKCTVFQYRFDSHDFAHIYIWNFNECFVQSNLILKTLQY